MATPLINPYNTYIGNNEATEFAIGFPYTDNGQIHVYLKRYDGEETELTTDDYDFQSDTVIKFPKTGSSEGVLRTNDKLTIQRETPVESEYVFSNQKRLFPEDVMGADDLAFEILQEHAMRLDRTLSLNPTSSANPSEVVEKVERIYTSINNIDDVADNITDINKVADNLVNINAVASDLANIDAASGHAADAAAAANSAEQTLVQTQAYVDSAKVEIDNTKNTAINTINTAVSNAESNISKIVSDAEGSITNIAVTEANKAIANAAQEATDTATANVNSYVNGTVKPSLQTYVDQAQEDANSAATSMEQAALSATAASNYASNASADADNAAESAGLAANSAAEASASETNAKNWAIKMGGLVDGEDYSAKYYADQARQAAAGAATDGKSITRNSDDKLQTIGVINQNDATKAIKTWSGTKAQYDALPSKDADTLYNITDDSDAQTYEAYTKSETDALVNAKQDKITGVSGVGDYVVEWKAPTSDDPSWYRKYKSGWIEQGGFVASTATDYEEQTVTFPKTMANNNYTVQVTAQSNYTGTDAVKGRSYYNPTTTSIKVFPQKNAICVGVSWQITGMGA